MNKPKGMKLLSAFLLLLAVVIAPLVGRGQALPTASGPGSNITVGGTVSAYQADYGKRYLGGASVFVDVHPHWRYGLEGEARYLRANTDEGTTETTYLGGVHVYLLQTRLQPYVKFLAGVGRFQFPFGYGSGTYLTYAPGGGADFSLGDRFAVRVLDFEYQSWPQFTYGSLHPYGVSAGISFRLNAVRRLPRR